MADATRELLKKIRHVLLAHHKTLLDSERARYDHDVERIKSSGHMLNLVLHDPFFAWLHELSELIVMIDETLDAEEPATPADAARLLAQALLLRSRAGPRNARCSGYCAASRGRAASARRGMRR